MERAAGLRTRPIFLTSPYPAPNSTFMLLARMARGLGSAMRGRLLHKWRNLGMPDSDGTDYISRKLDLCIGSGFYSRILVEQIRLYLAHRTQKILAIMHAIDQLDWQCIWM